MAKLGISERMACRVLGQHRSTQRKAPMGRADEAALTVDVVALATQYGRYGYRRIAAMLQAAGWAVNVKRGGLGREREKGRPDLAAGGAQGAEKTTQKRPALAGRRVVRPAPAGAGESCLVLRLHGGPDP